MNTFLRLPALLLFLLLVLPAELFAALPIEKAPEARLMESPLVKSAIIITFFAAIAFFLRFLYGPKGKLRETGWNALNAEHLAAEEHQQNRQRLTALSRSLEPLMQKEGRVFQEYVSGFYSGDKKKDELFRLKDEHSHKVFKNAWSIINGEAALQEPTVARALLLAALYHDIGRFEQLRAQHNFSDRDGINHSLFGARLLADGRFMADESAETRRLVRAAIALHSLAELPARIQRGQGTPNALAARALRDADKLDIIRVMLEGLRPGTASDPAISYGLPDEPALYNPEVVQKVLQNQPVYGSDMRYANDFRLRLCGWVGILEFEASRHLLARRGHMETIMGWLPNDENMSNIRAYVRGHLGGN